MPATLSLRSLEVSWRTELALLKRILRGGESFSCNWGINNYCWSSDVCVPALFAREGETVHRCRKSGRFDESEGESEVSSSGVLRASSHNAAVERRTPA